MANTTRKIQFKFERLDNIRKERKMTRKQILKACNKSIPTWAGWRKENRIMPDDLERIAHFMGVNIDYLRGISDAQMQKEETDYQKGYRVGYMDCFVEALEMLTINTKTAREFVEIAEKKFEGDTRVDLKTIREEMS